MEMDLEVVPVLNKIDLPAAEPERVAEEIEDIVGIDAVDAVRCSAKTGLGVDLVLEEIVAKIPSPEGDPEAPLQALIIDSWFDSYLGVVSLVRIKNGSLKKNDKIKVMSTGQVWGVDRIGIFTPKQVDTDGLGCGEVGWVVCGIKDIHGAPVGDTLTLAKHGAEKALAGFKKVKPQVYAGLFPISSDDYESFRDALEKLSSTMPPCSTNRRAPRRWASASAAASSGCCTWRSSRSVWSVNTIWISSPPHRPWSTRSS